jgi:hypothetical protein
MFSRRANDLDSTSNISEVNLRFSKSRRNTTKMLITHSRGNRITNAAAISKKSITSACYHHVSCRRKGASAVFQTMKTPPPISLIFALGCATNTAARRQAAAKFTWV